MEEEHDHEYDENWFENAITILLVMFISIE
jgi:hypothetical protein